MNNKVIGNEKDIIFYNDEEGNTKIEVLLQNEDVWLNTEIGRASCRERV